MGTCMDSVKKYSNFEENLDDTMSVSKSISTSTLDGGMSTTTTTTLDTPSMTSVEAPMNSKKGGEMHAHNDCMKDDHRDWDRYDTIITGSRSDIGLQRFDISSVINYWLM